MKKTYPSIRVFQSSFLEYFTHVPVLLPALIWGPVVAYFFWRRPSFGMLGLGVVAWTLAEYVLHRFIFHFNPKGHYQERLQFIMHGMHHADEKDPTRLVMSPVVALGLAVLFYAIFSKVIGQPFVDSFFAGFVLGYLWYDYTHYYIHHFKPTSRVGKTLKRNHLLHHHSKVPVRWGVSTPLWDHVFGTYRAER